MDNEDKAAFVGCLRLEEVRNLINDSIDYDEAKRLAIPFYASIQSLGRKQRQAICLMILMVELIEDLDD